MTFPRAPETEEEREALPTGGAIRSVCPVWSDDDYPCTRAPRHDGPHIAAGILKIYAVWEKTP